MALASGIGDGRIVWHSRTHTRCVLFSMDWFDVLGIEMLILSSQILIKGFFFQIDGKVADLVSRLLFLFGDIGVGIEGYGMAPGISNTHVFEVRGTFIRLFFLD